ncbi:MAG: hypothetical protein WC679_12330 [Bacteroidales bacterium]|jgi:hypothetical protein
MVKTIRMQDETWKEMQVLRVAYGYITMEELLKVLISNHKFTNKKQEEEQVEEIQNGKQENKI